MPLMKFLRDALISTKGPYERYVGRHTRDFCKRADRQSKTPIQRKIWFTAAISADEVIASLAGLEKRRTLGALAGWQVRPKADRKSYPEALRLYLSALLLLYGTGKEDVLSKLGMTEGEFMQAWLSIFQYEESDKAVFDDILTPAFRSKGIDGLVDAVGGMIRNALFLPSSPFGKQEQSALQDLMIDDLAAIKRLLSMREEDLAQGKRK
ncbi:MAG TPA: hypothetical protein VF336_00875 [Syntrophales bacterium]